MRWPTPTAHPGCSRTYPPERRRLHRNLPPAVPATFRDPRIALDEFHDALKQTLARNEAVERERREEVEQRRREEEQQRAAEQERRRAEQARRDTRHGELVQHLEALLRDLIETAPDRFVARGGWTESGEEYVVKVGTVQMRPRRSLFLEIDRDDDEVLARWSSDIGESIEMWRLLEVEPAMLTRLLLQLADHEAWLDADRPPAFPR